METTKQLFEAVEKNDTRKVKELLKKNAHVNATDEHGGTALMAAAGKGYTSIVKTLLSHGAQVNTHGVFGLTALMLASAKGAKKTVELLINHGADVNSSADCGETALMEAAVRGKYAVCTVLLEHNADINAQDHEGNSALMKIALESHKDYMRIVLDALDDIDDWSEATRKKMNIIQISDNERHIPEDAIIKAQANRAAAHKKIVKLFLKHGANIAIKNNEKEEALDLAHDNALKKLLLEATKSDTPIKQLGYFKAADPNDENELIAHDADVNIPYDDSDGWTRLLAAASGGTKNEVEFLINHGADVNMPSNFGITPLMEAAVKGKYAVCTVLLEHNADINARDRNGNSALMKIALESQNYFTRIMLDALDDIRDWSEATQKKMNIVQSSNESLIPWDAMIKAQANRAAAHKKIVKLFLKHGADIAIKNNDGKTALDLAHDNALKKLLLEAQANKGSHEKH
ncbi:MAG: ankyrin repeat domain-containing protein [Candidatus Babeliales bacterium]